MMLQMKKWLAGLTAGAMFISGMAFSGNGGGYSDEYFDVGGRRFVE
ncbi:MAG: hypothetical protein LUF89_06030 [Ruminococcus sp.]|nr:hypothetical protein [Ruminococcus sp.]